MALFIKQECFDKGAKAFTFKNYSATIYWMQQVVAREPDCLEAHILMRQAASARWQLKKRNKNIGRYLWIKTEETMACFILATKVIPLLKKRKKDAVLNALEEFFLKYPEHQAVHRFLILIAKNIPASYPVAWLSFEALLKRKPRDSKLHEEAALFCLLRNEQGRAWNPQKAKELYENLLLLNPHRLNAQQGINRATAALALQEALSCCSSEERQQLKLRV